MENGVIERDRMACCKYDEYATVSTAARWMKWCSLDCQGGAHVPSEALWDQIIQSATPSPLATGETNETWRDDIMLRSRENDTT